MTEVSLPQLLQVHCSGVQAMMRSTRGRPAGRACRPGWRRLLLSEAERQLYARLSVFAGGFDLSPIVVWIAIIFLQRFLVRSLYELAYALR